MIVRSSVYAFLPRAPGLKRTPLPAVVVRLGRGDDDPVAHSPSGDGLGQDHCGVGLPGSPPELDPGPAHGCAMDLHAAATADDGGARLAILVFKPDQPDNRPLAGLDRPPGSANQQGWPGFRCVKC